MEEDSAPAPNETHPLLPIQGDASLPESFGSGNGSTETAVDPAGPSSTNANPTSDEDVTDECCRRSTPPCGDDGVVNSEPKTGNEYSAIIEMLKDAEKAANDPEYEEKAMARKFGAIKYNPRHQESNFGVVDYFCALFQCCAVCIEG